MDWATFWTVVLYGAIGIFSVVSLWVIVGGFGDIRRMFRELRQQGDDRA